MKLDEIKKFKGQKCTVRYGRTAAIDGTILEVGDRRLRVDTRMGEYGIPVDQVRSITAIAGE